MAGWLGIRSGEADQTARNWPFPGLGENSCAFWGKKIGGEGGGGHWVRREWAFWGTRSRCFRRSGPGGGNVVAASYSRKRIGHE